MKLLHAIEQPKKCVPRCTVDFVGQPFARRNHAGEKAEQEMLYTG
jgi:hypothetical protein